MSWPPQWKYERCYIVGGGPSVRLFDAERLRGKRVIGINEAGLSVVPWCDILFWSDKRWLEWNRDRLYLHTGQFRAHRHTGVVPGAAHVRFRSCSLSKSLDYVGGHDSGSSCINLAYLLGCSEIVLLGFECRDLPEDRWQEGNFHNMHLAPPVPGQRENRFLPAHRAMASELRLVADWVRVMNATPDSALDCWEKVDMESVL